MKKEIFVLVEHLRGQVLEISHVMLAAAQTLAPGWDAEVVALLLGHNAQDLARDLAADRVFYIDHPDLEEFTADPYLHVLANLIQEHAPRARDHARPPTPNARPSHRSSSSARDVRSILPAPADPARAAHWWALQDSNLRPSDYESPALTD